MRKLTVSPGFMQRSCDNQRAAFCSDQPAGRLAGPCGKEDCVQAQQGSHRDLAMRPSARLMQVAVPIIAAITMVVMTACTSNRTSSSTKSRNEPFRGRVIIC